MIALSILVVSMFAIVLTIELFQEKSITYSENILKQISYNLDTQLSRIDQDTVIFRVGEAGAGNVIILINQIIVAINITGISEALVFGKKAAAG